MKRRSEKDPRSTDEQGWRPCSRGILQQVAEVELNRRRKILKLIAGGTALAAVGGGVGLGVFLDKKQPADKRNGLPMYGGVVCASVMDLMPSFLEGKLDEDMAQRTTVHLMDCLKCRKMYDQLCSEVDPESRPKNPKFKTTPFESH